MSLDQLREMGVGGGDPDRAEEVGWELVQVASEEHVRSDNIGKARAPRPVRRAWLRAAATAKTP